MNPAAILLVIQGIQAAISAAPMVEDIAVRGKDLIASLFRAGLISVDQQNALHAHVDQVVAALLNERTPPEFVVEPDPV